ncbi:hypothetical protein CFOL_v3_06826 [Cephalotus follicularis]|uniref:Uncharacterized protein n=1 Tax=Cephalotus follicularis TaxID=3775 RepID=A0A1Q3B5M1_CEPFO|nr:hypothetical protein CFOL_v3_06826 [Cephalotus follicularis]
MIKAVKKLKFWTTKKRKRSSYEFYYPPPPPPLQPPLPSSCHHCCCSFSPFQPSAPPLTPWLGAEQTHESGISPHSAHPIPEVAYPSLSQLPTQEIVTETSLVYPALPSYQQYMVPDPVYDMLVIHTPRKEKSGRGFFGCIVNFGIHLIRCLFPCYRVQQVY